MNRHKRLFLVALALGLGLTVALLWLMGSVGSVHAETVERYVVPIGGDDGNDCTSGNPCATIQRAVEAANPGDEILVAAGTYTGIYSHAVPSGYPSPPAGGVITQMVYLNKSVTVRGGYNGSFDVWNPATFVTTLDAGDEGRVIVVVGGVTATVEGFYITGGDASGLGGGPSAWDTGGGVYFLSAAATLSDCQITANAAGYGGGVALSYSDGATLSGNTIQDNSASGLGDSLGGGVFMWESDATLYGNTFLDNAADRGGGAFVYQSDALLDGNAIQGNTADRGGGVYVQGSANSVLDGNDISSNTADYGGGVALDENDGGTLSDNTLFNNTANTGGGGIYLSHSDGGTLRGNVIISNTGQDYGGGAYLWGDVSTTLSANIFEGNETQNYGGGIFMYVSDRAVLSGNTFYDNVGLNGGGGLFVHRNANTRLDGNFVLSNTTPKRGGGVYLYRGEVMLDNNVIADNQAEEAGAGVFAGGSAAYLRHNTLIHNHGGGGSGLYVMSSGGIYSSVALTNTVLVSHAVGIRVVQSNTARLNGVLWYGNNANVAGTGAVTVTNGVVGDPAFAADGYHITLASAAFDAGVEGGVTSDVDGDLRISGDGPDLGADDIPLYLAPNRAGSVLPGERAVTTHTLANHADVTQTFGFATALSPGWEVDVYVPGMLSSTLLLPFALAPGETTVVTVAVQAPAFAISDTVEAATITATGSLAGRDALVNLTTVLFDDVAPALEPGRSSNAQSGELVVYTHTLTNRANAVLTFDLEAVSSSGCAVSVAPATTEGLAAWGGSTVVTVTIKASGALPSGTADTTVVTATVQGHPSLWATASDTTTMLPAHIYLPLVVREFRGGTAVP